MESLSEDSVKPRLFHFVELKLAYDGTTNYPRIPKTPYVPTGRRYLQTFRGICLQAVAKRSLVSREPPKVLSCDRDTGVTIQDKYHVLVSVKNTKEADEMRSRYTDIRYNTEDGKPLYPCVYHHVGKKYQQLSVIVTVTTQINLESSFWHNVSPTFPRIWTQMGLYRHYLRGFANPREVGLCRNNCMCGRCLSLAYRGLVAVNATMMLISANPCAKHRTPTGNVEEISVIDPGCRDPNCSSCEDLADLSLRQMSLLVQTQTVIYPTQDRPITRNEQHGHYPDEDESRDENDELVDTTEKLIAHRHPLMNLSIYR